MNIVVTRYINDQPAHRHVRLAGVRSSKANRVVSETAIEERDRLERGNPTFRRDIDLGHTIIMHRRYDGATATVFVSAER